MAELNIGSDPINPAYYAGTACAEIIECLPTNVGFVAKYAWRLGEKDSEKQEAGKAAWYLQRELNRPYQPILTPSFYDFAAERVVRATQNGKLDFKRSEIVMMCVVYGIDGQKHHLERAIQLFQTY